MEELQKPEYGPNKRKHLIQNSSLLGHMEKSGLLKNKTRFIEFGAGHGQLSYWLEKAMENNSEATILLIDKASHRHYDNHQEFNMQRIRADIADLDITQIEHIHKYEQVVAVSKHLCGAATDMALHCVVNGSSRKLGTSLNVTGIIMAFCCHHRCNWDTYTGKQFLEEKGFTSADFQIIRGGIVSWATCGSGRSRDWDGNLCEEKDYNDHQNQTDTTRYLQLNLDQGMRKFIGRQCKLILDYGRLKFLKRHRLCYRLSSLHS